METITINRPDDWHIHLRDDAALAYTVRDAQRQFKRCIVMPNLAPPITNAAQALAYRDRILAAVDPQSNEDFTPLMVLYLTDRTTAKTIHDAAAAGITACKLYPAGATTNSDGGVTELANIYDALAAMEECGMPLLIHGEVTDIAIDIFDREKVFIDRHLRAVRERFSSLKIVFEHITTKDAVDYVMETKNLAATITAHHLLFNRNHMLAGGIRPHYYCLPILKRSIHQQALLQAATGGSSKFFLGTDSAPHARSKKEAACGCAGSYTAFHALELYAQAFDQEGRLDSLNDFAAVNGPGFYGLPTNNETITLIKKPWQVPADLAYFDGTLVPIMAEQTLMWQRA